MGSETWIDTTVGELCDNKVLYTQTGPFGSSLHKHDYVDSGIPVIPTEAIGRRLLRAIEVPQVSSETANRLKRHRVHAGDILFARRGIQATGLSAIMCELHEGWICGTGAILLRVLSADIDPVFLSFVLASDESFEWLRQHAVGAVMPNLNESVIRQLPLRIPPIRIQNAIASTLGTLDDKIELNRRMNETLESMARALFKSWFVDFDPVIDNALVAGNAIPDPLAARAATRRALGPKRKPLPESIQKLFPATFTFSEEMGWIPEGWEVESLDTIVDIISGGTPSTSDESYWTGSIPWFSVVDAPDRSSVFILSTEKTITDEGLANCSAKLLPIGTTIISARGTVGKCGIVSQPMAMNQSCYGIRGKEGITDYFVYYTILNGVSDLQLRAHGSVFSTITRNTFSSTRVAFGGKPLVQGFDKSVESLFEKVRENGLACISLAKLRDILLPKLLSGELRIPEAEKLVAGSV